MRSSAGLSTTSSSSSASGSTATLQAEVWMRPCAPGALQFMVERKFARGLGIARGLAVLVVEHDDGGELGVLARLAAKALDVARGLLGGEQPVELRPPRDEAVELGAKRGLHCRRYRRASISASARRSSPAVSCS